MSDAPTLEFGESGRIPVVAQDAETGAVLMLAYATPAAVDRTLETGLAHYYSRSREEIWQKGEASGHVQRVADVRMDCDGDALLYRVEQTGGACHTGHRSCFHRAVEATGDGAGPSVPVETTPVGERVFDPDDVYE